MTTSLNEVDMGHNLDRVLSVVQTFRDQLDPGIPAQQIELFLTVCRWPDIYMSDLANRLNTTPASASRNVAALGKVHRLGKEGYGLLEAYEDPGNRRRKRVRLTRRGESFRKQILRDLE